MITCSDCGITLPPIERASGVVATHGTRASKAMTGVEWVWVQYRGEYMPDLISGQVQAAFTVIPRSIDYIRTGQLRALAVTSAAHLEVLPGVPTVDEFVPGYEASSWFGVGALKGTSTKIIEKLNKEIDAIVAE